MKLNNKLDWELKVNAENVEPELYLQIHLDILSLYIMCALPLKLIFIFIYLVLLSKEC